MLQEVSRRLARALQGTRAVASIALPVGIAGIMGVRALARSCEPVATFCRDVSGRFARAITCFADKSRLRLLGGLPGIVLPEDAPDERYALLP